MCFHAQQAAEKAIKALLIQRGVQFPYTHDIAQLLTLLEDSGQPIPQTVREAERLTQFAVLTRYPGLAPPVQFEEYETAVATAEEVVRCVEGLLKGEDN